MFGFGILCGQDKTPKEIQICLPVCSVCVANTRSLAQRFSALSCACECPADIILKHLELQRTSFAFISWQFVQRNKKIVHTALNNTKVGRTNLKAANDVIQLRQFTTKDNQELCVRGARDEEVDKVEQIVRQCAESGDGFNIDEFCPDNGHFLHKFIHQPKTVVVVDQSESEIKAAGIFGFSEVSRLPGSLYTAYFIVKKEDRRKGIGTQLLRTVEQVAKKEKCDTLLIDVFINNQAGISFLKKHLFLVTGCIPHCGFIVNHGFTDSLLMYKKLDQLSASDLVAKI